MTFAQGAMTSEPAGVVTSTAQDELRCVLIFTPFIGAATGHSVDVADSPIEKNVTIIQIITGKTL